MNQLQVDLADMNAFGGKPYPFMLVAIDALTKKVDAEPLKDRLATTAAAGMKKVFQSLGVPANVYSDDGTEFKREFKQLLDFWDIEKQVTRGHAYFAERTIRTIKAEAHRRRRGASGAVAPHAARHLEPNQREEAQHHTGGARPSLRGP
ncbi:MAG: DDE-type integrase/transposase/recombinase [Proteobacteria bacterium]|nr:DDE-type integrase/transposase/recombinase [Pseudomonadota bacterium]